MKRSEFELLTKQMQDAHNKFFTFMDTFTHSVVAGNVNKNPRRYMTDDDQRQASAFYQRKQELEDRWLDFMRSPEPVEEDSMS